MRRRSAAYKRVKGFQPLQVTWDRYVIDAVFRGGTSTRTIPIRPRRRSVI